MLRAFLIYCLLEKMFNKMQFVSSSEHQRFKGKDNEQHLMYLNGQNFVYVRDHVFGQGIHLAIVFTDSTTKELIQTQIAFAV